MDDEGAPVPQGEIGNLRVKGDSTMAYYWNKHEKTKETLFGAWIQTGDKYYQDADGYFWYAAGPTTCSRSAASGCRRSRWRRRSSSTRRAGGGGRRARGHDRLVKPKAFVVLKEPGGPARDWPTS